MEFALCITGKSLKYALRTPEAVEAFTQVTELCKSVICCRVSPSQKAEVTTLVKNQGRVTLGIGDGANDVGMIQAAHIGVGISGQEGMQAVMASDFAIAQFKFLERLLLVHGRWNYLRITKMVVYFFYKNILFGLTLFYFNAFAFFSGQTVYNAWSMTFYNVIFTVFPVLVIGTFDQDVSPAKALLFPRLYEAGIDNEYFTFSTCAWCVRAAARVCGGETDPPGPGRAIEGKDAPRSGREAPNPGRADRRRPPRPPLPGGCSTACCSR